VQALDSIAEMTAQNSLDPIGSPAHAGLAGFSSQLITKLSTDSVRCTTGIEGLREAQWRGG
jgi:hypothetical protein